MNHFGPVLRKINNRLTLPQPVRAQIILEIAADLEDAFEYYTTKGLTESAARQQALEKFDLTDEALTQLVNIHDSTLRKFIRRLSAQTQSRWERTILLGLMLFSLLVFARAFTVTPFFLHASKFVWPILAILSVALPLAIFKFYQLSIKKDHQLKRLRQGLPLMLFFSGGSIVLGVYGFFIETWLAGNQIIQLWFSILFSINPANPDLMPIIYQFMLYLMKCSTMLITSFLVTIFLALLWFVYDNKITQIERAEAAILLKSE